MFLSTALPTAVAEEEEEKLRLTQKAMLHFCTPSFELQLQSRVTTRACSLRIQQQNPYLILPPRGAKAGTQRYGLDDQEAGQLKSHLARVL